MFGGAGSKPLSLRDAFMRVSHLSPLSKYECVLAEDPGIFLPLGEYIELLSFESDIAQLSELLVLFSESFGSAAELGVFVMDDEVSPKLLVIIDDKNFSENSFVTLGPLFSLKRRYGDPAVCVLKLSDLNIGTISDVSNINLDKFLAALESPLIQRLAAKREPRTFDKKRNGHVTKLITGLIQHYGALTIDEIDVLLYCLHSPRSLEDIRKHILCAERFRWIHKEKRGISTYYAARAAAEKSALSFRLKPGAPIRDRQRWKSDIRDYWKKTDPDRFSIISLAASGRV
jgi:hypothetical protein